MRRQGGFSSLCSAWFCLACPPALFLVSDAQAFFPSASRIFSLSVYSLPFFSVHGLAVGNSYVYDI